MKGMVKDMLFEKEYRLAEEKLYKKGYYVDNMVYDDTLYEVYNKNHDVVIDYLSLTQLIALSNLL